MVPKNGLDLLDIKTDLRDRVNTTPAASWASEKVAIDRSNKLHQKGRNAFGIKMQNNIHIKKKAPGQRPADVAGPNLSMTLGPPPQLLSRLVSKQSQPWYDYIENGQI